MSSEHVFGQIVAKWRSFHADLETKSIRKVVDIIEFAFRMHNLLKEYQDMGRLTDAAIGLQTGAVLPHDAHEDQFDELQAHPDVEFVQHANLAAGARPYLSSQGELEQGNALRAELKAVVNSLLNVPMQ